jgi:SSU ribosomal protein S12P methylthiotransferase (EC 2.-.-.-)
MTMITNSSSVPAEAEQLADLGVKELILVAQDTTAYGIDIYGKPALGKLIDRLSRLSGIRWGSSRVDLQACKLGTGRRFTTS